MVYTELRASIWGTLNKTHSIYKTYLYITFIRFTHFYNLIMLSWGSVKYVAIWQNSNSLRSDPENIYLKYELMYKYFQY